MKNNFDDYMDKINKVKLDPSRRNLKPVKASLTFEQYLDQCIKEGNELLESEAKNKPSVTTPPPLPSKTLDDVLGDNVYVRARRQILLKMNPEARSVIEKMENGTLPKDHRYDTFCKEVRILGDQLSSK